MIRATEALPFLTLPSSSRLRTEVSRNASFTALLRAGSTSGTATGVVVRTMRARVMDTAELRRASTLN